MPKIDIPAKRLIQICPRDWVLAIMPECENAIISKMEANKVPKPKAESRLDSLLWIQNDKERFILNIEPQGYLDPTMPARMLRYRADVWEYTITQGLITPSIKQAVVYFYPQHENQNHRLVDSWGEKKTLEFEYDAVRVWKMKKAPVIEKKLVGLYPLLPLMEQELNETPDIIMENTVKTIETVAEAHLRADLLAVVSILAGEKYSSELVKKYVRREMLMSSPIFAEWVKEEREEAAVNKTRKIIIRLLVRKFDLVPKSIREDLAQINDEEMLDELLEKTVDIDVIEEFSAILKKAIH